MFGCTPILNATCGNNITTRDITVLNGGAPWPAAAKVVVDDAGARLKTDDASSDACSVFPPRPVAQKTNEKPAVTVNIGRATHRLNELTMGCHLDLGFVHEQRNYFSQMIYGESVEVGSQSSYSYTTPTYDSHPSAALIRWNNYSTQPIGSQSLAGYARSEASHGYASLQVEHTFAHYLPAAAKTDDNDSSEEQHFPRHPRHASIPTPAHGTLLKFISCEQP
eukprot:SAG11_NODE_1954_length_4006_cov_1.667093_2_plen_222_part_00